MGVISVIRGIFNRKNQPNNAALDELNLQRDSLRKEIHSYDDELNAIVARGINLEGVEAELNRNDYAFQNHKKYLAMDQLAQLEQLIRVREQTMIFKTENERLKKLPAIDVDAALGMKDEVEIRRKMQKRALDELDEAYREHSATLSNALKQYDADYDAAIHESKIKANNEF